MSNILSSSDINRIRASVQPPVKTHKETQRIKLKQKSMDRTENWPNTLEAMRRKKDNWKKEKELMLEQSRLAIDVEENRLQQITRLKQIEKANQLMYEQTDKMKTLRSKQLLADVLQDRKVQIMEKKVLQKRKEDEEKYWDAVLRQQLADAEIKDKMREKIIKEKHSQLAKDQKQQLEAFKKRHIEILKQENEEGERISLKAEKDYLEEQKNEQHRRLKAQQANEETKLANNLLKALREKEKEKEVEEEKKRQKDAEIKSKKKAKQLEMQELKKQKKQAQKQKMIDLAVQHLSNLETNTNKRLENQQKEVREKEESVLRQRAERRRLEENAMKESYDYQISRKTRLEKNEREQSELLIKKWTDHNIAIEMDDAAHERDRKIDELNFSHDLKLQTEARKQREMEEKVSKLLSEKDSQNIIAEEDSKYREIALSTFKEAQDNGMDNTIPLQSALKAKSIDLLPAGGFRV